MHIKCIAYIAVNAKLDMKLSLESVWMSQTEVSQAYLHVRSESKMTMSEPPARSIEFLCLLSRNCIGRSATIIGELLITPPTPQPQSSFGRGRHFVCARSPFAFDSSEPCPDCWAALGERKHRRQEVGKRGSSKFLGRFEKVGASNITICSAFGHESSNKETN